MIQSTQFPLKISTGGNEVIATGTVHLSEPEVKFELANLIIKYKFVIDSGEPRYTGEIVNNEMVISLHNFNNSLGEGILKPIEIGTLNGRDLLATCYVHTTSDKLRQFHYTFMLRGV